MKVGWEYRKLGEVCDVIGGGTPSKDNEMFYLDGDIPWATVRDMKLDVICQTEFRITKEAVKNSSTNVIPKGNVVIATRVGLGKVCFLKVDAAINQDLKGVIPKNTSKLLVGFLFQWFKNIAHIIQDEGTGATVQGVKLPFIKSLIIPIPPINEQQRIVTILDEAFDGIATAKANAEKNLQNARALFESHLQSIFTQRGEGWVEKKFGDVCGFVRGPFGGSLKKSIFVADGYAVYEQQHAIYDQFDDIRYFINEAKFQEMKRFVLLPNDLIMSCSGTMGRVAIVPDGIKRGIINQALLKLTPSSNISNTFLKYWMESEAFQDALKEYSGGAAIQNVASVKILKEIKVPLPSIEEQERVVDKLESISAETQHLEAIYQQKITALDALKKTLLDQAFKGEL
jgi:type I restriction enzyme S subunit